jgi:hypothetical protein
MSAHMEFRLPWTHSSSHSLHPSTIFILCRYVSTSAGTSEARTRMKTQQKKTRKIPSDCVPKLAVKGSQRVVYPISIICDPPIQTKPKISEKIVSPKQCRHKKICTSSSLTHPVLWSTKSLVQISPFLCQLNRLFINGAQNYYVRSGECA